MRKNMILYVNRSSNDGYNAGSKAVVDAMNIARECGYSIYYFYSLDGMPKTSFDGIKTTLINIITTIRCFWRASVVVVQHPILSRVFTLIVKFFSVITNTKIVVLVHDIFSYRKNGIISRTEAEMLKTSSILISHTPAMSKLLGDIGISSQKMRELYVFDYVSSTANVRRRVLSSQVCFAGNLDKSLFLQTLNHCIDSSAIEMYLYGVLSNNVVCSSQVYYRGKFDPNDIANIEGSWGLVWDGDSCETCSGSFGEYMKINSPHKVSLYIAAELPIVIWEGSALAEYITRNKWGIAISSLHDLADVLANVSESEYQEYIANIKKESERLRCGLRLKEIL